MPPSSGYGYADKFGIRICRRVRDTDVPWGRVADVPLVRPPQRLERPRFLRRYDIVDGAVPGWRSPKYPFPAGEVPGSPGAARRWGGRELLQDRGADLALGGRCAAPAEAPVRPGSPVILGKPGAPPPPVGPVPDGHLPRWWRSDLRGPRSVAERHQECRADGTRLSFSSRRGGRTGGPADASAVGLPRTHGPGGTTVVG